MKNTTEFYRVIKNSNYSVINNEFIRRKDLSWKAKGILTYILTLPDDWKINMNELMTHATDGERSFRSGWKELTTFGYVERKAVRKGNRIEYWETVIREKPDVKPNAELCYFEEVQNEDVQSEDVQNDDLLSTNNTKYLNKQNTNNTKDILSSKDDIPYSKIVNYLNGKVGTKYRPTSKKTQSLIKARFNEGFTFDDFKEVINKKTDSWLYDKKMKQYLRPETLFGTKFESYLNEPSAPKQQYKYGENTQPKDLLEGEELAEAQRKWEDSFGKNRTTT